MEAGRLSQAVMFVQWKLDTTYQYINSFPIWLILPSLNLLNTGKSRANGKNVLTQHFE
jgi:hypothetical protein